MKNHSPEKKNRTSSFKNVLLETAWLYEDERIVGTETRLACLRLIDGKIADILPNDPQADAVDAQGKLMLPAFRDMHTHLDKSLYGLPWKAVDGKNRTVQDMIALEQRIIPELLASSVARSQQLISLLQGFGIHHARSHFNVDPTSGLDSLYHLQEALAKQAAGFSAELVAFPQHGIFYTDSAQLMREAAGLPGVDFIGGLDPYSIDGSIAKPLDFIVQLALDEEKGIDIHLHETGFSGMQTIHYLLDRVLENPALKGKTTISHAYALAYLSNVEAEGIAERLVEAEVAIASAIPFAGMQLPIPTLVDKGVKLLVGNDNIQDHWATFGSGNILEKMRLIAELYQYVTEEELARTLGWATGGITPLNRAGEQQWPKAGDAANFVLVDASCSAEAVARVAPVCALVHQGKQVF